MRCLYCDKQIQKYTFTSLLLKEDKLCGDCRSKLKIDRKMLKVKGMKVETFFDYDGMFKNILIQYKECCDEALKDVFLYGLSDYIFLRYLGYEILFVPSSSKKLSQRGFNHLQLIFENCHFKEVKGLKMKEDYIQEGKNFNDRALMEENYYYEGKPLNKVLVVDDVITTGASLYGVYKTIRPFSNKIQCLALARVRKRFHS